MEAYMTYGAPGSGKTSFVKQHPDYNGANRINLDLIRLEFPRNKSAANWSTAVDRLILMAQREQNIFIDNTHIAYDQWMKFYTPLKEAGFKVNLVFFKVPLEIVLRQNESELRHATGSVVPREVVRLFYEKMKRDPKDLHYPRDKTIVVERN